jgi:hypothetical protein
MLVLLLAVNMCQDCAIHNNMFADAQFHEDQFVYDINKRYLLARQMNRHTLK